MPNRAILSSQILLVGPDEAVLAVQNPFLNQPGAWTCIRAESGGEALWRLRQEREIDAVIVAPGKCLESVRGPGPPHQVQPAGRGGCRWSSSWRPRPPSDERRFTNRGPTTAIQLPAPREEIVLRVLNAIRVKQATDSLENATAVITSLANAIEGRDRSTCGHVERVAMYAAEIAKQIGLPERDLSTVRTGGLVHDIGKVVVPDHILNKPGRLTNGEMDLIRRHPVVGYEILKPLRTLQDVLPIVRWHHEKPNGRGYPDGLKGDEIPLLPRIVAVADCFDAISTDRPYRPAMSMGDCRKTLLDMGEAHDLSKDLVGTLLEILAQEAEPLIEIGICA